MPAGVTPPTTTGVPPAPDTLAQTLLCAVLHDHLQLRRPGWSLHSALALAQRRLHWLRSIDRVWKEYNFNSTSVASPSQPTTPTSETIRGSEKGSPSPLFKKLDGLKKPKFLKKAKGMGYFGRSKTVVPISGIGPPSPPGTPPLGSSVMPQTGLPSPYANSTGRLTEVDEPLLLEIETGLKKLQQDRRNLAASTTIITLYLGLLAQPEVRHELKEHGVIEDLIWLYGKVVLLFKVVDPDSPQDSPPPDARDSGLSVRVNLPSEVAAILSVVKMALGQMYGSSKSGTQRSSGTNRSLLDSLVDTSAENPTARTAMYQTLLQRLADRTNWYIYVLLDTFEPGPMTTHLATNFGLRQRVVLSTCRAWVPAQIGAALLLRFQAYYSKLMERPVTMASVNHLYSPLAYRYWLENERHNVYQLIRILDGTAPLTEPLSVTAPPPHLKLPPPQGPAPDLPIALPLDPHANYRDLINILVDRHLVKPLGRNTEADNLAFFITSTPGPANQIRGVQLPCSLPSDAQDILQWCARLWYISVPFRRACYLQAVFRRVESRQLPLFYLQDALAGATQALQAIPHQNWSHFDNDTIWTLLSGILDYIERQLTSVLAAIDYYPNLDHFNKMPANIQVRVSLRWYTLRTLLVLRHALAQNPLVQYYQQGQNDYTEALRIRIHRAFEPWFKFWSKQFAPGNRSPSENTMGFAELLCAISNTFLLAEKAFGLTEQPELAQRCGYPDILNPCTPFLDIMLGRYLNDLEAWISTMKRQQVASNSTKADPLELDLELCGHLSEVLSAAGELSLRVFQKSKVGPLSQKFTHLYVAQMIQAVQTKSQEWVQSVLRVDQAVVLGDDSSTMLHTSSADDILCCIFEPFDLLKSIPALDPALGNWARSSLMGMVYYSLDLYCSAMHQAFLDTLQLDHPTNHAKGQQASPIVPPTPPKSNQWKKRMFLDKFVYNVHPAPVEPIAPKLVIEPMACRPLNNLYKISERLHGLFSPFLPTQSGTASGDHPLAHTALHDHLSDGRYFAHGLTGKPTEADRVYTVMLTIVHAEGLDTRHQGQLRNPYIKVAMPQIGLKIAKTTTQRSTAVPRWDEVFPVWISGPYIQSALGSASCPSHESPLITLAVYDRDKMQSSTLCGIGRFPLDLTLYRDTTADLWVPIKPRGRVLIRVTCDTSGAGTPTDNPKPSHLPALLPLPPDGAKCGDRTASDPTAIHRNYTRITWLLRRTLNDLMRQTIESMVPAIRVHLSRARLLDNSAFLAKTNGSRMKRLLATTRFKPSTKTRPTSQMEHPNSAQTVESAPLDGLFQYLNRNLAVLFQHCYPDIARPLILNTWREIVLALVASILPSLPTLLAETNGTPSEQSIMGSRRGSAGLSGMPTSSSRPHIGAMTQSSADLLVHRRSAKNDLGTRGSFQQLFTTVASTSTKALSKPSKRRIQLGPEEWQFMVDCLDAIQDFFTGDGDPADGNSPPTIITHAQLQVLPEFREWHFIREWYFAPTAQLIREYMHALGRQLDILKQWNHLADHPGRTPLSAGSAGRGAWNNPEMLNIELVDYDLGSAGGGSSTELLQSRDRGPALDSDPKWLRSQTDLILRILQTRHGIDKTATDFVSSHYTSTEFT
ncbi:hypothetical protein BJ085DRAFT_38078 [Dimargaris cristalligena]|uniref:C2 domain-containing protein n=1 Tax=Dimargaris cristalligena TaxID=215637 RepID=A0A4V1J509_9FUNG|nr:hypothetical protein BJ085DRAFT_38078 [Dimargaris cristalligena]|eukprot:RKP37419.1 hypothetical protein BJ085DRAFT_38078 [Dimargaris cristalligena]